MPTAAKKAPARKPAGRRPAASKTTAAAPAKRTPARRAAAADTAPAKKAPARRLAAVKDEPAPRTRGGARETNALGFVPGTDSSLIAEALLLGGADRKEVNAKATARVATVNGLSTRGGGEKSVTSLVSGVLRKLRADGYTVESSFRVVPPKGKASAIEAYLEEVKASLATEKRRAARKARAAGK